MKKKLLPLAMLAGLAGAAGTAQAVHLSADGLGQVLIYPYYTVESGQDTYVTVVNTTNQAKAVKVRFLEGENSQEVLDFNLYLSPYDHWAGAITSAMVTNFETGEAEPGAKIVTGDTSCTAPAFPAGGVPFREYAYAYEDDPDEPGFQRDSSDTNRGNDRTREGYIEIVEMGIMGSIDGAGVITEAGANEFGATEAVTHVDGVPADCSVVTGAWAADGEWTAVPSDNIAPPTGGLYGYGVIIDVAEGTTASYDASAVDNFFGVATHTATGSLAPSLNSAQTFSDVFDDAEVFATTFPGGGIDAVSSVFMRDTLSNDYVLDDGLNAETSWVVTFPTKRFYVQEAVLADRAPFSAQWDGAVACESIALTYWDREEGTPTEDPTTPGGPDFSPLPPQFPADLPPGFNLCTEVNIINFGDSDVLGSDNLAVGLPLADDFVNGWAMIDFEQAVPFGGNPALYNAREIIGNDDDGAAGDTNVFTGLPVVGFAVQKYLNGTLEGGSVLANYTAVTDHKYTRDIERVLAPVAP